MGHWLHENSGAIWSLIFGTVLGVAGNWLFFKMSKHSKQLTWELVPRTAVLQDRNMLLERRLSPDGRAPGGVGVRITNAGRSPIVHDDFVKPVMVHFPEGAYTRASLEVASNDAELQDVHDLAGSNRYSFKVDLLNPGEWVEIHFLTEAGTTQPELSARLVGETGPMRVASVKLHRPPAWTVLIWTIGLPTSLIAATYGTVIFFFSFANGYLGFDSIVGIIGGALCYLLAYFIFAPVTRELIGDMRKGSDR